MTYHRLLLLLAALLIAATASQAGAQAPGEGGARQGQVPQQQFPQQPQPGQQQPFAFVQPSIEVPMVELAPLLQRVERASNKRFLVDRKVGPRIFLGGVETDDVTYPVLLSILRANALAAVEIDGRVNIVLDADVRFLPAPMTQADDASIAADEWVTRVLTTTNIEAEELVPILRPMMPQSAHLSAHATTNRLILMDRYANIQRITAIVRSLDVAAPARN